MFHFKFIIMFTIQIQGFLVSDFRISATTATGGLVVQHKETNQIFFIRKKETGKFLARMNSLIPTEVYIAEVQKFTSKKTGMEEVQNVLIPAPKFV